MAFPSALVLIKRRFQSLLVAFAAIAAVIAVLFAYGALSAQEDPPCEVSPLGQLSTQSGGGLHIAGTWSAQDCGSEYRPGTGAQYFEFDVIDSGRIRIELTSDSADPYLYLLADDGTRIADDDDSGALLNARIERDLAPGTYQIEATTVGDRSPTSIEFGIAIEYVDGCEIIPLGMLAPDSPLSATGSWSLDSCGSRIVVTHPAYNYLFELPEPGRVRIDLTSEHGDPVLSLATLDGVAIGADDDGGVGINSRIEQYLPAGTYIIEATTYSQGGLQPAASDFELAVRVVDEQLALLDPNPKVEFLAVPDEVVSGDPFPVHFRVGNHGGGGLHGNAASYLILVRGPENRHWGDPVPIAESSWAAGSSYHTGEPAAGASSTTLEGVAPVDLRLEEPGRSWVLVALYALNEENRGLWFHAAWKHVNVLESAELAPTLASVDGRTYSVSATADADGMVSTTVSDIADRQRAIDSGHQAQAIYATGIRRLLLEDLFGREKIAGLEELTSGTAPGSPDPELGKFSPQSGSILARFAHRYLDAVTASGLAESGSAGYIPDPAAIERVLASDAESARRQYATLANGWRQLRSRVGSGGAIEYTEALALHAQLHYAESVLEPAIRAGELVAAARAAEAGWEDDSVQAQLTEYAAGGACPGTGGRFAAALDSALPGVAETQLALDTELRLALPAFGASADYALCATGAIGRANDRFFNLLKIESLDLSQLPGYRYVPAGPDRTMQPHIVRILARLSADGTIEHAVELADGSIILPERRFLDAAAAPGRAHYSSPVQIAGLSIGSIRTQLDAQGQIQLSFQGSDGVQIAPRMRIIPAGASIGTWLRSSPIEVPAAAPELSAVG